MPQCLEWLLGLVFGEDHTQCNSFLGVVVSALCLGRATLSVTVS